MVKDIVDTFYNLAKAHKLVRSFKYDRLSKGAGIGDELMPHVFLEDPIYFGVADTTTGTIPVTVNFDVVITKQLLDNWKLPKPTSETGQNLCHSIALNFIARLRNAYTDPDQDSMFQVSSWTITTLRHWYDNDCDGVRVSLILNAKNDINYCDEDSHFDDSKEFDISKVLPSIDTDGAEGCSAKFGYKLCNITL